MSSVNRADPVLVLMIRPPSAVGQDRKQLLDQQHDTGQVDRHERLDVPGPGLPHRGPTGRPGVVDQDVERLAVPRQQDLAGRLGETGEGLRVCGVQLQRRGSPPVAWIRVTTSAAS